MTRVLLPAMAAALLAPASPAAEDRPDVIIVLADDLGWGDLSCYGGERAETPHLDRMAREGVRFTQYYAGSTVCAPSRTVLMTGLHTGHSWIRGNGNVALGGDTPLEVCLAETRQAGYAGIEMGGKFPKTAAELRPVLAKHGLALISGWYSARLLERDAEAEIAAMQPHLDLMAGMGCAVMVFAEVSGGTHGDHAGDMPAIFFTESNRGAMSFLDDRFLPNEVRGRAVIVHAAPDNYGNVPVGAAANQYTPNSADATTLTQTTGNAGARILCGVIQ